MKVINQGSELEIRKKAWWVGLQVECNDCSHKVELQWEDRDKVASKPNDKFSQVTVYVDCPVCHGKMIANIPASDYTDLRAKANAITQEEFSVEQGKMPI